MSWSVDARSRKRIQESKTPLSADNYLAMTGREAKRSVALAGATGQERKRLRQRFERFFNASQTRVLVCDQ